VQRLFAEKDVEPNLGWRVVPKDPGIEWGFDNAELVSSKVRRALVAAYGGRSGQHYQDVLEGAGVVVS